MFATNAKFGKRLPLVLHSMFDHCPEPCRVFIYYSAMSERDMAAIRKVAAQWKQEVVLQYFDIKKVLDDYGLQQIPAWFGSFDAYTRIFATEDLYAKGIDKVAYMDCDVLVVNDMRPFLKEYDKVIAIAGSTEGKAEQTTKTDGQAKAENTRKSKYTDFSHSKYVNSGVLLFNLKYTHEHDFVRRCVNWMITNIGKSKFPDQDAINCSIDFDDISSFDNKFNMLSGNAVNMKTAVIKHYTGFKPWEFWRKWDHAKFVYYKFRLYYFLLSHHCNVSKSFLTGIFSTLEFITKPLTALLNLGHDLNRSRRRKRHLKRRKS